LEVFVIEHRSNGTVMFENGLSKWLKQLLCLGIDRWFIRTRKKGYGEEQFS